eukprot:SAG11_NODE_17439_length_518_cov_3.164678_1_plen_57_part_10
MSTPGFHSLTRFEKKFARFVHAAGWGAPHLRFPLDGRRLFPRLSRGQKARWQILGPL